MSDAQKAPLTLGHRAGRLVLELETGQHLSDRLRLEAGPDDPEGRVEGTPIDWPAGTKSWVVVTNRGGRSTQTWNATVEGPWLRWLVDPENVNQVARSAWAELWLEYPDGIPWLWREGAVQWR